MRRQYDAVGKSRVAGDCPGVQVGTRVVHASGGALQQAVSRVGEVEAIPAVEGDVVRTE